MMHILANIGIYFLKGISILPQKIFCFCQASIHCLSYLIEDGTPWNMFKTIPYNRLLMSVTPGLLALWIACVCMLPMSHYALEDCEQSLCLEWNSDNPRNKRTILQNIAPPTSNRLVHGGRLTRQSSCLQFRLWNEESDWQFRIHCWV